MCEQMLVDST